MKSIIGGILIAVALGLGYMGINKINNSSAGIEIGGLEISASDSDSKTTGFIYLGLAVASMVVGGSLLKGQG